MITIVDYGLGNVRAFLNVYRRLNIDARAARTAAELQGASKIILPGVGSFDHAMELLERSGMRDMLDDLVLNRKVPVLGVCVGMQILARSSDEGQRPGLAWIDAAVRGFKSAPGASHMALPHMGWNDVRAVRENRLMDKPSAETRFYFLHSYYLDCEQEEDVLAVCDYGIRFSCAVNAANIFGVQFHPEKSHAYGVGLLRNFAEL